MLFGCVEGETLKHGKSVLPSPADGGESDGHRLWNQADFCHLIRRDLNAGLYKTGMLTRLVIFHRFIVKGLVEHNEVLRTRQLLLHAMSYNWVCNKHPSVLSGPTKL